MQHHLTRVSNVFDRDNITRFLQRYTNKAWVSHYAIITKASLIKDWIDRLAKQIIRI